MPPLAGKGKKGREARRSRSRNTTPSSVISGPLASASPSTTAYLGIDVSKLLVPSHVAYSDILDRHGGGGGIPDPKLLETLVADLKALSQLAEVRGQACDTAMRELSQRRKDLLEEQREKEKAEREAEEIREKMKREAQDDDDEIRGRKIGKLKKRKERSSVREERPPAHGAHGVARQDGLDVQMEDAPSEPRATSSRRGGPSPKKARATPSGSTSSLSPPEQLISPTTATAMEDHQPIPSSPSSSNSSLEDKQPPPAPATTNYQTFGPNPLKFDDPTLYHIRDVTDDMDEMERKVIYCVSRFPKSDLSDRIAGTIPDKDFSNAKPSNQVNATTFATYIEPHVRPLGEDEAAFLKERGDRTSAFMVPVRGKKHWSDIFTEEDGAISVDSPQTRDRLPLNRARGSLDQISDDTAQTDQISIGPTLTRLFGSMRYENRPAPGEEREKTNGLMNGDTNMGGTNEAETNGEAGPESEKPLPPATTFAESSQPGWKMANPKMDHQQMDERLKVELRYLGLLNPDEPTSYDDHFDDDIASRMRKLQIELKKELLTDGARKTRILELAKERMALQEYRGILEDLDSQVSQAYLKRTRTLGKSKKSSAKHHRPGGAGGGSHPVGGSGISKPGIGDVAKTLMERRHRWIDNIGPIFQDTNTNVPTKGQNIFDPAVIAELEKVEEENWADDADEL